MLQTRAKFIPSKRLKPPLLRNPWTVDVGAVPRERASERARSTSAEGHTHTPPVTLLVPHGRPAGMAARLAVECGYPFRTKS